MTRSQNDNIIRALDYYVRHYLKPLQDQGIEKTRTGQTVSEEIGISHELFMQMSGGK
jgi:hypothetical protein